MAKWSDHYRRLILNVLPEDGSLIRAKEIFDKLKEREKKEDRIGSPLTISKYLDQLRKEGLIRKEVKSHKQVFYQRTENAELELKLIKLTRLWRNQLRKLYSHLNEEDRQTLLEMLEFTASSIGATYERYARRKRED